MACPCNGPIPGSLAGAANPNNRLRINPLAFTAYRERSLGGFDPGNLQPAPNSALVNQVQKLAWVYVCDPSAEGEVFFIRPSPIEEFVTPGRAFCLRNCAGNVHEHSLSDTSSMGSKRHRFRPVRRMDLAENLRIQGDSCNVVGRPRRDVRLTPKTAPWFSRVLIDNDGGKRRPANRSKGQIQKAQGLIPASMRFMPFAGTVKVGLRKLTVENLAPAAPISAGNGRKHGVQVIKINFHEAGSPGLLCWIQSTLAQQRRLGSGPRRSEGPGQPSGSSGPCRFPGTQRTWKPALRNDKMHGNATRNATELPHLLIGDHREPPCWGALHDVHLLANREF